MIRFRVRVLNEGIAEGEALVSGEPISFLGDVDPHTGMVINRAHPLHGLSVKDKVLIFPYGRGSTVGSYIIYQLKRSGAAPKAIINLESEQIVIVGCILAGIPLVDKPTMNPIAVIKSGDHVRVDGINGEVTVEDEE